MLIQEKEKIDIAHDIHPLLEKRFSPRAFSGKSLTDKEVGRLFEAVRWAPSCYNDQPWSFLIATPDDGEVFERLLECINEFNRTWSAKAGLLGIALARTHFAHNGHENRHAWHDVGQALGYLTFQASAMDLYVHQMAGFSPERTLELFDVPEGYEPVTAFAVGYLGQASDLPEKLAEREQTPQKRRPQGEFVFRNGLK